MNDWNIKIAQKLSLNNQKIFLHRNSSSFMLCEGFGNKLGRYRVNATFKTLQIDVFLTNSF